LVLQQKVEAIFHQGATSICEAVEVQIASTIVSLDREERDRLLLQEEGDVVQIYLDESERFKVQWVSKGIFDNLDKS